MATEFPETHSLDKLPKFVRAEVEAAISLLKPARVVLVGGSVETKELLYQIALEEGEFVNYNQRLSPRCAAFNTREDDASRVPITIVECPGALPIGDQNNGITEEGMREAVKRFDGDMAGKTMYILPWRGAHHNSPLSNCGVVITDSPAFAFCTMTVFRCSVASLRDMRSYGKKNGFSLQIHAKSDGEPESRFVIIDRENNRVYVRAHDYLGASLPKKNVSMRAVGYLGYVAPANERFIVEHAAMIEIIYPDNVSYGVLIAKPSACGKTSDSTMDVPDPFASEGTSLITDGDDHIRGHVENGRLVCWNPEDGGFLVCDETDWARNPNVMEWIRRNAIYSNVGRTKDDEPTWKGDGRKHQEGDRDWLGAVSDGKLPKSHPNGRAVASLDQLPTFNRDSWERGTTIDQFVLGVRRTDTLPLMRIARDWEEFLFYYATMLSEKTAASKGQVGVLEWDPGATKAFLAMPPLLHIDHLHEIGAQLHTPIAGMLTNVFRKRKDGSWKYPGYRENFRLYKAGIDIQYGRQSAVETPTGLIPSREALNLTGLSGVDYDELFEIVPEEMRVEYGRYEQILAEQLKAPKNHFLWKVLNKHKRDLGIAA